jgi:pilus assembly protein Flp/PilA
MEARTSQGLTGAPCARIGSNLSRSLTRIELWVSDESNNSIRTFDLLFSMHVTRQQGRQGRITMLDLTEQFGRDDAGGTSLEYGLIAAGIAVGISMVVISLGTQLKSTFAQIAASPPYASSTASFRPARLPDGP